MIDIENVTMIQNKKGTSYRFRIYVGEDASGKKLHKYKTWKPPKEGLSEKKLRTLLLEEKSRFEQEVKSGLYTNTRQTLQKFCADYLTFTASTLSPTTQREYSRIIRDFIIPSMGYMKLKDIQPYHVQQFVQALQEPIKRDHNERYKGRSTRSDDSQYLKPATVKKYYSVLQSVLARACKLGLIPTNPADSKRIDLPKNDPKPVVIFTTEEARHMLSCLETEPPQYRLLIHLAIITGARRGELVALKWENIHLDEQRIDIILSNYKLTGEQVKSKAPKSRTSTRSIAIPSYLCDMLLQHRKEQLREATQLGDRWQNPEGWVFTQWDGSPMHPDTPSAWFTKFQKRHGIPHHKLHAIRHTSATLLVYQGADIKAVSSRLGHAQLATTNIYLHALESADIAAANTLGDLFAPTEREKIV